MPADNWKACCALLIILFKPTIQQAGHNYGALYPDSFQNAGENPMVVLPEGCIEMCDEQGCLFFCPQPSKQIKRCVTKSMLNKRLCCTTDGPIAPTADSHQILALDPLDPETMKKYGGLPLKNLATQRNAVRLHKAAEAKLQLQKTLNNLKALREKRKNALANVKSRDSVPLPYKAKLMPTDLKDLKPAFPQLPLLDLTKIKKPLPILDPSYIYNDNGAKTTNYPIMETNLDDTDQVSHITADSHGQSISNEQSENIDAEPENVPSSTTDESASIIYSTSKSNPEKVLDATLSAISSDSVGDKNEDVLSNKDYTSDNSREAQLIDYGKPSLELKPVTIETTDLRNESPLQGEGSRPFSAIQPNQKDTDETSPIILLEPPIINESSLLSDTDVNYKTGNSDTPSQVLVETLEGKERTPFIPRAEPESKSASNLNYFPTAIAASNEDGNSEPVISNKMHPFEIPERTSLSPGEGVPDSENHSIDEPSYLQSTIENNPKSLLSSYDNTKNNNNDDKSENDNLSAENYSNKLFSNKNISDPPGQENSEISKKEEDKYASQQPMFQPKSNIVDDVLNDKFPTERTILEVNREISKFLRRELKDGEYFKTKDRTDTPNLLINDNEPSEPVHLTNNQDGDFDATSLNSDAKNIPEQLKPNYSENLNRDENLSPQILENNLRDYNTAGIHDVVDISPDTSTQLVKFGSAEKSGSSGLQVIAQNKQSSEQRKTKNKIICITDDDLNNHMTNRLSESLVNVENTPSDGITEQNKANNKKLQRPVLKANSNEEDKQKSDPVIAYYYNNPRKMDLHPLSLTLEGGPNIESNDMTVHNVNSNNSPQENGNIAQSPDENPKRNDNAQKLLTGNRSAKNKKLVSLPIYEMMPESELSAETNETPKISIVMNGNEIGDEELTNGSDSRNTPEIINSGSKGGSGDSLANNFNNPLDLINNTMSLNLPNDNIEQRSAQDRDYFKTHQNPSDNSHFAGSNTQGEHVDVQHIPDYRPVIENDFFGDLFFRDKPHRDYKNFDNTWYDETGESFKENFNGNSFNDSTFNNLNGLNFGNIQYEPYVIYQPEIDYGKKIIKIKPDPLPTKNKTGTGSNRWNIVNGNDLQRTINPRDFLTSDDYSRSDIRRSVELDEEKINQTELLRTETDKGTDNVRSLDVSYDGDKFRELNNYENSQERNESMDVTKYTDDGQNIKSLIGNKISSEEQDPEIITGIPTNIGHNEQEYDKSPYIEGELKEKETDGEADKENEEDKEEQAGKEEEVDYEKEADKANEAGKENRSDREDEAGKEKEPNKEEETYNEEEADKEEAISLPTQIKNESLLKGSEEGSIISNNPLLQLLDSDVFQTRSSEFDEEHISDRSVEEIEKIMKDGRIRSLLELYSLPTKPLGNEQLSQSQPLVYPLHNTNDNSKDIQESSELYSINNNNNKESQINARKIDSPDSSKPFINREREILIHEIKKFIDDPSIKNVSQTPSFNDDMLTYTNLPDNIQRQISNLGTGDKFITDFSKEGNIILNDGIPYENDDRVPQVKHPISQPLDNFTNNIEAYGKNAEKAQKYEVSDNSLHVNTQSEESNEKNPQSNIYDSLKNTGKEKAIKSALNILENLLKVKNDQETGYSGDMKFSSNRANAFNYANYESMNNSLKSETSEIDNENYPIQEESLIPKIEPITTENYLNKNDKTIFSENSIINEKIQSIPRINSELNINSILGDDENAMSVEQMTNNTPYRSINDNVPMTPITDDLANILTSLGTDNLQNQNDSSDSKASNEMTSFIKTSLSKDSANIQRFSALVAHIPKADMREEIGHTSEMKPLKTDENKGLILGGDPDRSDPLLPGIYPNNNPIGDDSIDSIKNFNAFDLSSKNYLLGNENILKETLQPSSEPSDIPDNNSYPQVINGTGTEEKKFMEHSTDEENLANNSSFPNVYTNGEENHVSSELLNDRSSYDPIIDESIAKDISDGIVITKSENFLNPDVISLSGINRSSKILNTLENIYNEDENPSILGRKENGSTINNVNNEDFFGNSTEEQTNGIFNLYNLLGFNRSQHLGQTLGNGDDTETKLELSKSSMQDGALKCSCNGETETSNESDSSREKRSKSSKYPPIYIFSGGNYVINIAGKPSISIIPKRIEKFGISDPRHTPPSDIYKYIMGQNAEKMESNEVKDIFKETKINIPLNPENTKNISQPKYSVREPDYSKNENGNSDYPYIRTNDKSRELLKPIDPNEINNLDSSESDLSPTSTERIEAVREESFHPRNNGQDENDSYNIHYEENKNEDNKEYDSAFDTDNQFVQQDNTNNHGNSKDVWNNVFGDNNPKTDARYLNTKTSYGQGNEGPHVTEGTPTATTWSYHIHGSGLDYPAPTYIYVRT